jgi:hypothetical protein
MIVQLLSILSVMAFIVAFVVDQEQGTLPICSMTLSLTSSHAQFLLHICVFALLSFCYGILFGHSFRAKLLALLIYRLNRTLAGFPLKPTHLKASKPNPFITGSPDSLNLTDVMFSSPVTYHVIVGAHGVGKSVAVELAAAEASKSRTVKFLEAPPTDLEFFKLFYEPPLWLQFFGALRSCVCLQLIASMFAYIMFMPVLPNSPRHYLS